MTTVIDNVHIYMQLIMLFLHFYLHREAANGCMLTSQCLSRVDIVEWTVLFISDAVFVNEALAYTLMSLCVEWTVLFINDAVFVNEALADTLMSLCGCR